MADISYHTQELVWGSNSVIKSLCTVHTSIHSSLSVLHFLTSSLKMEQKKVYTSHNALLPMGYNVHVFMWVYSGETYLYYQKSFQSCVLGMFHHYNGPHDQLEQIPLWKQCIVGSTWYLLYGISHYNVHIAHVWNFLTQTKSVEISNLLPMFLYGNDITSICL